MPCSKRCLNANHRWRRDDSAFNIVKGRCSFSGSNIGGIAETQEMLDFYAEHNVTANIELINVDQISEAFSRLEKGDMEYRFVVDMSTL